MLGEECHRLISEVSERLEDEIDPGQTVPVRGSSTSPTPRPKL